MDVVNLLESAGFSSSNPYYIVRQGKVDNLCKMTNRQRLDLLMEVAGTKVYDDRKRKSDTIMKEDDSRREQINEILEVVSTRLAELEHEKRELLEYQGLDKRHRALKFCIYNAELDQTRNDLTAIGSEIEEEKATLSNLNAKAAQRAAELHSCETEAEDAGHAGKSARRELARCEREATELQELRQSLAIELTSLEKQIQTKEQEQKEIEKASAAVEAEILEVQEKIQQEVRLRRVNGGEQSCNIQLLNVVFKIVSRWNPNIKNLLIPIGMS